MGDAALDDDDDVDVEAPWSSGFSTRLLAVKMAFKNKKKTRHKLYGISQVFPYTYCR